ncbi:MAG: hypothetical protein U9N52_07370 [Campylobacterota bacterium]|nr:hypothetical protein [Campylobacterota bacterium]
MLAIEIDNKELEQTLFSKFHTPQKIKEYFYRLVVNDLESQKSFKENEAFEILSSIKIGLDDVKKGKIHPIGELWDKIDD